MTLFILRGFETYSYTTHTMFIATSVASAMKLCDKFAKALINEHHNPSFMNYDDEFEHQLWYQAFHESIYVRISEESFDYEYDLNEDRVCDRLYGMLKRIESDEMIQDATTDGD